MKTPAHFRFAATALFVAIVPTIVSGQGPLTPPAAPAPTMKTLDQVEARIIVNAANTTGDSANSFIINSPGSYYLTGNVQGASGIHGISIQADNVTLDLNGFAIISGGGTTRGVNIPAAQFGITIRNGSVSGWTGGGVRADLSVCHAVGLNLSGCTGARGLTVGNGSLIEHCVASNNDIGFYSADRTQITNCIATINGQAGFSCNSYVTLIDCTASRNTNIGISVGDNCSLLHCNASRNTNGIFTGDGNNVVDCTADSNDNFGIYVYKDCTVRGCTARGNVGNWGIFGYLGCHLVGNTSNENSIGISGGSHCRIDGNNLVNNSVIGLHSVTGNNFIVRNSVTSPAGTPYVPAPGDATGVIITVTSGAVIDNVSPWANFTY